MFHPTREHHEETNTDMVPCGLKNIAIHSVILSYKYLSNSTLRLLAECCGLFLSTIHREKNFLKNIFFVEYYTKWKETTGET